MVALMHKLLNYLKKIWKQVITNQVLTHALNAHLRHEPEETEVVLEQDRIQIGQELLAPNQLHKEEVTQIEITTTDDQALTEEVDRTLTGMLPLVETILEIKRTSQENQVDEQHNAEK
jgi:hypothetical protein